MYYFASCRIFMHQRRRTQGYQNHCWCSSPLLTSNLKFGHFTLLSGNVTLLGNVHKCKTHVHSFCLSLFQALR